MAPWTRVESCHCRPPPRPHLSSYHWIPGTRRIRGISCLRRGAFGGFLAAPQDCTSPSSSRRPRRGLLMSHMQWGPASAGCRTLPVPVVCDSAAGVSPPFSRVRSGQDQAPPPRLTPRLPRAFLDYYYYFFFYPGHALKGLLAFCCLSQRLSWGQLRSAFCCPLPAAERGWGGSGVARWGCLPGGGVGGHSRGVNGRRGSESVGGGRLGAHPAGQTRAGGRRPRMAV